MINNKEIKIRNKTELSLSKIMIIMKDFTTDFYITSFVEETIKYYTYLEEEFIVTHKSLKNSELFTISKIK